MNKTLLLLLVTLVQSQSDGILLPTPINSDDNLKDLSLKDLENSEVGISEDTTDLKSQPYSKRSGNDVLMRRSALDKNFMRFGRNPADGINSFFIEGRSFPLSKTNFFRFGRGNKDNFIRFGRGGQDNLFRFGRGGKENFIRFGRGTPEDFFRSGKSLRESFIRFGKSDKNFMRFGRSSQEICKNNCDNQYFLDEENFERNGKSIKTQDNFIRFGRNGNQKEGRNGTNFLRFGKKGTSSAIESPDPAVLDFDERNEDESYLIRRKRQTKLIDAPINEVKQNEEEESKNEEKKNFKTIGKRSTEYFGKFRQDLPLFSQILASNSWQELENSRYPKFTPFFPIISDSSKNPNYYWTPQLFQVKRTQGGGGSNFIRFG